MSVNAPHEVEVARSMLKHTVEFTALEKEARSRNYFSITKKIELKTNKNVGLLADKPPRVDKFDWEQRRPETESTYFWGIFEVVATNLYKGLTSFLFLLLIKNGGKMFLKRLISTKKTTFPPKKTNFSPKLFV
jgi:hypothetical protein